MTQADLAALRRHGGRIADAAAAFPHAPRPWLDLSTGINPRPWQPDGSAFDPAPLPDVRALARLEEAAARFFGADPARVAAVPGSEIALRLLGALGLPRPLTAVRPCYGTHAEVADRLVEADAIADIGAGTLLLANPNNPDGRRLSREALGAPPGGWLVVDEAFADAEAEGSVVPGLGEEAAVIVLRSFGKFFGLAGVRLGFVIAPPAIVALVRALLGDWPVSAQAIGWGTAAYADAGWIAATRAWLAEAAAELDAVLARHGLAATGESPLFRLVEDARAPAVFERLARAGVLVRPFAERADWLRFGLPAGAAELERLDRALAGG